MCLLGTIGFTNLGRIEKVYFFLNSEISFKIVKFGRNCDGFILVFWSGFLRALNLTHLSIDLLGQLKN